MSGQVVRIRYCTHAACRRLVKGLPGAVCMYHAAVSPQVRREGRLTPKMKHALALLCDHGIDRAHQGTGVVSTDASYLSSGQPWINFHTARALQRAGLARIDYSWDWPEVELTDAGWAACALSEETPR